MTIHSDIVSTPLDVEFVRSRFPALSLLGSDNAPLVFLDSPGGTQVPTSVIEAVSAYYAASNSNTEGEFNLSKDTDEVVAKARMYGGTFVGGDPRGIAFGQNTTTLNFLLSRAVGRLFEPGDEIIVTALDHDANVAPWLLLAEDRGFTVRTIGLTESTEISLEELNSAIGPKTRVVAFPLASNAVGTLAQAQAIVEIAHDAGALAWADGVAYAAHRRLNVRELGVDVLLTSPYKYFAPHLGMAWIRPELADKLTPERVRPASWEPIGHRFETGTLSHEAMAGFNAAIEYIASLGDGSVLAEQLDSAFDRIGAHEELLTERLYDGLSRFDNLNIKGVPAPDHTRRLGTVSVAVRGGGSADLARRLGEAGVLSWNGNFYAQGVMEALDIDMDEGLLRFGVIHYNTTQDVDRALEALQRLID